MSSSSQSSRSTTGTSSRRFLLSLACAVHYHWMGCQGWAPPRSVVAPSTLINTRPVVVFVRPSSTKVFSTPPENDNAGSTTSNDAAASMEQVDRTSFDQAGASLIEEEDRKRLEQMGDFDENKSYQQESIDQMRAAIRQRTANLGLEKSKVTADYIAQKEKTAREAGPPGVAAQNDSNSFGGLDLTQISQVKQTNSDWDESLPTMLYNPEDDLSREEQEEADPIMLKGPLEQGLNEVANSKWPDPLAALQRVVLMFVVIGLSTVLVTQWDSVLRTVYMRFGFIPTPEDIVNYASRFDGLDLPNGWTSGMTDGDVKTYSDALSGGASDVINGMPEL